jgi:hypothetical protein
MRRRRALLLLAAAVVGVPKLAAAQAHPDFSGKWSLDASKSEGAMVPQSSEVRVTQNDKVITIARASQTQMGPQTSFATLSLDGTPSKNTMNAQGMAIELSSTAKWDDATLVVTTDAEVSGGPKLHQVDRWSLDADKRVATMRTEGSFGDQGFLIKLVFNKQ